MSGGEVLPPHRAHARRDVDRRARLCGRGCAACDRPGARSKCRATGVGMKRVRERVDVPVAARGLLCDVEALRHDQVQLRPWRASSPRRAAAAPPRSPPACRSRGRTGCSRRRRSARTPTSTPGPWPSGWSRGSGSPRRSSGAPAWSLVACGGSSVSSVRKRSREAIAGGDLLELLEVGARAPPRPRACARDAARTSAAPRSISAGQPAARLRSASNSVDEARPVAAAGARRREASASVAAGSALGHAVEHARRASPGRCRAAAAARGSRRPGRAGSRRSAAPPARP